MLRNKICVFAIFFLQAGLFAQQEIYFNNTNLDRKDIQVERMVQGVTVSSDLSKIMANNYLLNVRYFREDRIAPLFTIHSFVGLQNTVERTNIQYQEVSPGYYVQVNDHRYHAYYSLQWELGGELRWHFNHRARYKRNLRVFHNAGWFLGIPIRLSSTLLHQPDGVHTRQWFIDTFSCNLSPALKVGFRQPFGKHCFFESALACQPLSVFFTVGSAPYIAMNDNLPSILSLELKVAYVFD